MFYLEFLSHYLQLNNIENIKFDPKKEVRIKVTRVSQYGERYKLFIIEKNTFEDNFSLEDYGLDLIKENSLTVVDTIKWNGLAKKSGLEMGDYITEFKVENSDRPDKKLVYPIALILLLIFGYLNKIRTPIHQSQR